MSSGAWSPADVQAAFCAAVLDEWCRSGVTDVVVAPGSRSTPMLIAVADAEVSDRLRVHVVLDERSAGFFALGLGLVSGRPAPVLTTSGTAAVEIHPAVVEAHHAQVPMVVVTADRPPELQRVAAPQTIDQVGLYGSILRWEADPGVPDLGSVRAWRSLASRSIGEALGGPGAPGPVHLNLPFREPLLGDPGRVDRDLFSAGRADGAPWHRRAQDRQPHTTPSAEVIERLGALVKESRRGLIVAGHGTGEPSDIWELSERTGWPVLADPRSGCRRTGVIASADALLRIDSVRRWEPDLVLRVGVGWASRVLGEWLGSLSCPQILVDPTGSWADPGRVVSEVVVASPGRVCSAISSMVTQKAPHDWSEQWVKAEESAQEAIDLVLSDNWGAPTVARVVMDAIAPDGVLFASSSMPIRDVEWWARARERVSVMANRGANGIDGVTSTLLGVAAGRRDAGQTIGLIGDLAFLYDVGSLLGAANRSLDATIVVVDNDGGGIFSFLPQASKLDHHRFERFWATPHSLDLTALCAAYGVRACSVSSRDELEVALKASQSESGLGVIIARTERAIDVELHSKLHAAVAEAVCG